MRLNVFLNAYGKRHFVGVLEEQAPRIFFEYSQEFIATGINLSPFMLPLKSQIFEDTKQTFDGLFGVFNDSLPMAGLFAFRPAITKERLKPATNHAFAAFVHDWT